NGSQPCQVHIGLEENVIRKTIVSGILYPFLSFVELSEGRVYGADAVGGVMKVDEIFSNANRLSDISFGAFSIAAFRSQHRACGVEYAALIRWIVFERGIEETCGFIQSVQGNKRPCSLIAPLRRKRLARHTIQSRDRIFKF